MALISDKIRFVLPEAYFAVSHGHIPDLKLESATVSSQVDQWSRTDTNVRVTEIKPKENKVKLSNGREYTYKALVIAPGFDQKASYIEGLPEFEKEARGENNVFIHQIDHKERINRNYLHGWHHPNGDMICYSPKFPYKGEGCDFFALYYEHYLRMDRMQGRSAKNAKIQFWTPNKEIYKFPYANEIALEECHKRGIEVHFGWEMVSVKTNSIG